MAVTTLTCAFVTFCNVAGSCKDTPVQLALVLEDNVQIGEVTLGPGTSRYPVSVTRPTTGLVVGAEGFHAFGVGRTCDMLEGRLP